MTFEDLFWFAKKGITLLCITFHSSKIYQEIGIFQNNMFHTADFVDF